MKNFAPFLLNQCLRSSTDYEPMLDSRLTNWFCLDSQGIDHFVKGKKEKKIDSVKESQEKYNCQ